MAQLTQHEREILISGTSSRVVDSLRSSNGVPNHYLLNRIVRDLIIHDISVEIIVSEIAQAFTSSGVLWESASAMVIDIIEDNVRQRELERQVDEEFSKISLEFVLAKVKELYPEVVKGSITEETLIGMLVRTLQNNSNDPTNLIRILVSQERQATQSQPKK